MLSQDDEIGILVEKQYEPVVYDQYRPVATDQEINVIILRD